MKYGLVCPLLETWLFGCATALNGDWAAATGTAPIDYTTKPSLFPTTFFGFNSLMTNDDASHAFSSLLPDDWVGGPYGFGGYGTASQAVNDGLSAYPEMLNYTPAAYGNPNCVFNSRY